jgi:hypothetical protein
VRIACFALQNFQTALFFCGRPQSIFCGFPHNRCPFTILYRFVHAFCEKLRTSSVFSAFLRNATSKCATHPAVCKQIRWNLVEWQGAMSDYSHGLGDHTQCVCQTAIRRSRHTKIWSIKFCRPSLIQDQSSVVSESLATSSQPSYQASQSNRMS